MSLYVSVVNATQADLPAIAAMRDAFGWHPNHWLLRAVHAHHDACILLVRDPEARDGSSTTHADPGPVAAAAAVSYGVRGFIGNVMVQPSMRRQGLGEAVMRAALDWLRARGTAVVELDATPEGRPLYERLGFTGTLPSWFVHSAVGQRQRDELLRTHAGSVVDLLDATRMRDIAALDRVAFGGDRIDLLRHILTLGDARLFAARDESSEVVGFLLAHKLSAGEGTLRLGPWIATSPAVAADLLLHALSDAHSRGTFRDQHPRVLACVDGTSARAIGWLRACGLDAVEDDLRMRLCLSAQPTVEQSTPALPELGRPDWVYAMTAPMVG